VEEFEEADAYTVSPPNLRGATNYITTGPYIPAQTLPGGLKLWKMDPTGGEDHKLIAWFSPNGWVAIDFRESEPVTQIPPIGFRHSKDEEEQAEWEPDDQAHTGPTGTPQPTPRGTPGPSPKTTSLPTPKTTSLPTPKTTPVEK